MNFEEMSEVESELRRLVESAENAGRHGASWWDVLLSGHESLSKCCGRGASREELQNAQCYEVARAAIFAAWTKNSKNAPIPPPELPPFFDGEQERKMTMGLQTLGHAAAIYQLDPRKLERGLLAIGVSSPELELTDISTRGE